jgi:hypothetical protein
MAARMSSVVRQPWCWSRTPVSGMKMVLAKPATTIIARIARARRFASNQETMTAVAGSYKAMAMATPRPANTRYSCQTAVTRDQATSSATPPAEPSVINARPPCRSSHRPTGTAAAAQARTAVVRAPVTAAGLACRSAAIGCSRTAKA